MYRIFCVFLYVYIKLQDITWKLLIHVIAVALCCEKREKIVLNKKDGCVYPAMKSYESLYMDIMGLDSSCCAAQLAH